MTIVLYAIAISILSYLIGCFSTSRLIAKSFKSLNIYKVGSGHPDTENIYLNVSKPLGILTGTAEVIKVYLFLLILKHILPMIGVMPHFLSFNVLLFIFGFSLILGHCLPITAGFKGGRGIFNYTGMLLFFIPIPMIIIMALSLILVFVFNQIRFSNFMIVLFPPILAFFWGIPRDLNIMMAIGAIFMGIVKFIVSKRLGDF